MKIKNWNKFGKLNESVETFTYEMAQEIVYYLTSQTGKKEIENLLVSTLGQERAQIRLYNKKDATNFLKSFSDRNTDKRQNLIDIYHQVREDRKEFPEIYQIEDACLDLIEGDFFHIDFDLTGVRYIISLGKEYKNIRHVEMSEYIRYCEHINNRLISLSEYRVKILNASLEIDLNSSIYFKIEIRPNYGK